VSLIKRRASIAGALLLACSASLAEEDILRVSSNEREIKFSLPSVTDELGIAKINSQLKIPYSNAYLEGRKFDLEKTILETGITYPSIMGFYTGNSVGMKISQNFEKSQKRTDSEGYLSSWLSRRIALTGLLSIDLSLFYNHSLEYNADNLGINLYKGVQLYKNIYIGVSGYMFSDFKGYAYQSINSSLLFRLGDFNFSVFMEKRKDNYKEGQYMGLTVGKKF